MNTLKRMLFLLITIPMLSHAAEKWSIPLPRAKAPAGYVQFAYAAKNDAGERIEVTNAVIKADTYEKIEAMLKAEDGNN